jgi:hypothetical protein
LYFIFIFEFSGEKRAILNFLQKERAARRFGNSRRFVKRSIRK